ncbi:uncharacterized protein DS421_4g112990 [Arachis hypogaea]|nr:uncharacterized protein DS421_4g112990 [Arachis hypogaea]
MLICDHPVPLDRYNERVEEHLRSTGFYHVAQIGVVQCQKVLINALVEMWHPDTHTFHLPVGECAVTLEDVAMILGLPTDGLLVTGMTLSSFEALEVKCLHQFGVAPRKSDCRGRCIKLTWLWDLKARLQLTDENSIPVYVKCHIMLLIGTILFGDKSGASVHWKFLPLLRDFASIGQCSWGSACLAHLYRALCRASRFDCKEIDGPLTLLLGWAWIRLPYLAPAPREPRSFSLANRWRNWERGDRVYRYLKLAHFRKALDDLQEGQIDIVIWIVIICLLYLFQFVWVAYVVDCVDPDIIPADIYMHSVVFRRQFGFVQGVPHQEPNLDKEHGEVLTGPKNLNWATATTHSFWVMQWTNRYNHVLTEFSMAPQHPLDIYMYWYRSKYGNHLNLSNLVVQEDVEGNQVMDDDNQEHEPQSPPPPPPPPPLLPPQFSRDGASISQLLGFMASDAGQAQYVHKPDFMAATYSFDVRHPCRTSSGVSGGLVSGDSSRSDGGQEILNSQNSHCVSMTLIEENAKTLEHETNEYLVDEPDDEDDEEDEDEDMDENEESRNDAGESCTPDEIGKGYNLRVDPPRRNASRYTPSVFNKAAKKCKNLVKGVKWATKK